MVYTLLFFSSFSVWGCKITMFGLIFQRKREKFYVLLFLRLVLLDFLSFSFLHFRRQGACLDIFTLNKSPFQAPPRRPVINFGAKVLPFRHTSPNFDRVFRGKGRKTRSASPEAHCSGSPGVPQHTDVPDAVRAPHGSGGGRPSLPSRCCSVAVLQFSKSFPTPSKKILYLYLYIYKYKYRACFRLSE